MLIEDYLINSKSGCAYFRAGKIPTEFCSEASDYGNGRRNTELTTCHLHLQVKLPSFIDITRAGLGVLLSSPHQVRYVFRRDSGAFQQLTVNPGNICVVPERPESDTKLLTCK